MEKWQSDYIESMKRWFNNEKNQNNITASNIENAKKMVQLYSIELKNKKDQLEFDLKRGKETAIDFNKWCDDNDLAD